MIPAWLTSIAVVAWIGWLVGRSDCRADQYRRLVLLRQRCERRKRLEGVLRRCEAQSARAYVYRSVNEG